MDQDQPSSNKKDVFLPECPAEFFVVHVWFVFPGAPELSHHLGVLQLELAHVSDPVDHVAVLLVRQQLQKELPQLDLEVRTHYDVNILMLGNIFVSET